MEGAQWHLGRRAHMVGTLARLKETELGPLQAAFDARKDLFQSRLINWMKDNTSSCNKKYITRYLLSVKL